ncbi:AAA family ATPase [Mesoplasma photuris]|uniref:AAA family ATPase n=1 Tax=Mesoplasma photuris TaxID=217731 RepID=UPI0004E167CB|nr:AAA family ATPase [Mesoplasma photuris]
MKIQIIGAAGVGKTTLGKYISEKENIKFIDTDHYLWTDETFKFNREISERISLYNQDTIDNCSYVVAGSVYSWKKDGFNNRDILVFLFLDDQKRINRIIDREIARNGLSGLKIDENGQYTNEFIEWTKLYNKINDETSPGVYAEHMKQLRESKSKTIKLSGELSPEELYLIIKKELQK